MNCPFCGEKMLSGFLNLNTGMTIWSGRRYNTKAVILIAERKNSLSQVNKKEA